MSWKFPAADAGDVSWMKGVEAGRKEEIFRCHSVAHVPHVDRSLSASQIVGGRLVN